MLAIAKSVTAAIEPNVHWINWKWNFTCMWRESFKQCHLSPSFKDNSVSNGNIRTKLWNLPSFLLSIHPYFYPSLPPSPFFLCFFFGESKGDHKPLIGLKMDHSCLQLFYGWLTGAGQAGGARQCFCYHLVDGNSQDLETGVIGGCLGLKLKG